MHIVILHKAEQKQTLRCSLQLDPVESSISEVQAPACSCFTKSECDENVDTVEGCDNGVKTARHYNEEGIYDVCESCGNYKSAEDCKDRVDLIFVHGPKVATRFINPEIEQRVRNSRSI